MFSRRTALLAPLALAATPAHAASGKMVLSLHQNTSVAAGYRKSLEGWARAGIKNVELTDRLLDEFLKTDRPGGRASRGHRSGIDPGLLRVRNSGFLDSRPEPDCGARYLEETLRAILVLRPYQDLLSRRHQPQGHRRRLQGRSSIVFARAATSAMQYKMTAMIEFARNSSFISTLTTSLKLIREAAHPNVHPMLDCYHFWSGLSKFEDLDLLRPGELAHVHFQDVPDMPRELLDNTTRLIPGDGVSRWFGFCGNSPRKATPERFRWNCSCRSSRRAIPTRWRPGFVRRPKE